MIVMVNRWRNLSKRKKQTLVSLLRGFAFFACIFFVTKKIKIPLCPIKRIWGISCFGCGMSRGFESITRLDIMGALRCNVLSVLLFIACVVYVILAIIDAFSERNCIEYIEHMLSKKFMYLIYISLLALSMWLNNQELF